MGYPKYVSNFTVPSTSPWSGFSASAMLIKTFAPHAIASEQQFLSLRGTDVVAEPLKTGSTNVLAEAFARLSAAANPELLKPILDGRYKSMLPCDLNLPFPVWYLKQFRSADGSDTAVYQSLLEGPLTLRTMRNMGLLAGKWTLEAGAFDSLPFVTELGLGDPRDGKVTLTTKFGIWASMDYTSGIAVPLV
jgi:hypothetical protein